MLPFIGRPRRPKSRSQSSEHGVVATGEHVDLSSSLFVERHVRLLGAPEVMKQHRKLAGYGNDGLAFGLLATSGSQVQTPLSQRRVSSRAVGGCGWSTRSADFEDRRCRHG